MGAARTLYNRPPSLTIRAPVGAKKHEKVSNLLKTIGTPKMDVFWKKTEGGGGFIFHPKNLLLCMKLLAPSMISMMEIVDLLHQTSWYSQVDVA